MRTHTLRTYLLPLLLLPAAAIWACGGGDNVDLDGGLDATPDNTTGDSATDGNPGDAANDTNSDGASDAGQDVTLSFDCLKPADCIDGGDPDASYSPIDSGVVCCGTITGNGDIQACQFLGASTSCKAPNQCSTSFTGLLTCSSGTARLCSSAAECVEQQYNKCCQASLGDGGTVSICASTQIANASQGRITCP